MGRSDVPANRARNQRRVGRGQSRHIWASFQNLGACQVLPPHVDCQCRIAAHQYRGNLRRAVRRPNRTILQGMDALRDMWPEARKTNDHVLSAQLAILETTIPQDLAPLPVCIFDNAQQVLKCIDS